MALRKSLLLILLQVLACSTIAQSINGPSNVSSGETANYSYNGLPQEGDTYLWSVTGGTLNNSPSSFFQSITWSYSGTVTLKITNMFGSTTTYTKNVSVCSIPSAPSVPNQSSCGSSVTLYVSNPSGTYQWFHDDNTTGLPISDGSYTGKDYDVGFDGHTLTISNYTGSETVYVRKLGSCGHSGLTAATGTLNNNPVKYSVTGGGSYCSGGSGVNVGVSDSQTGVAYKLMRNGQYVGGTVYGPQLAHACRVCFLRPA